MKVCRECCVVRPVAEFPKQRASRDGHNSLCKPCVAARVRERTLRKRYGITGAQYAEMLTRQDGQCALCDQALGMADGRRLHVDHDHATGQVRALLCTRCNLMLGCARDDPTRLRAAADYLERHAP